MNKFQKFSSAITAMFLVALVLFSSCKKNLDQPPFQTDPAIVANTTIKALKAKHTVSGAYDVINTDVIIAGVVTASDESGNLYKSMFIQDNTGGIQVNLDASSIYGTFPVGRRVFIKCNGLCVSDYHNTPFLGIKATINGSPSAEAIPASMISKYLIGGSINNPVVPAVVTPSQLGTSMQDQYLGMLIQLDNMEFQPADTSKTYGDTSSYKNANDLYAHNCSTPGSLLDVRSSGYANFAAQKPAKGNGSLIAIYTLYGTTKQLLIRDTSDVKFYNLRCGVIPGSTTLLNEGFEAQTVNVPVAVPGWVNASEAGSQLWQTKTFGGAKYANMSAFGTAQNVVKSWLVTKPLNLGTAANKVLSFKTNQGFSGTGNVLSAPLRVLISTNYTGSATPWTSTWTDISSMATFSPGSATGFPAAFTPSGNISLNAYSGTIYVAFVYDGADPAGTASDKTSTWELDDITVLTY